MRRHLEVSVTSCPPILIIMQPVKKIYYMQPAKQIYYVTLEMHFKNHNIEPDIYWLKLILKDLRIQSRKKRYARY